MRGLEALHGAGRQVVRGRQDVRVRQCVKLKGCRGQAGVPSEVEGLEDLLQSEILAIPEDDHLARLLAQLALDEAQQMLLVHARAVVHMRVHLQPMPE